MPRNVALDDALRNGWEAYGRGDLAAAQAYAAQAHALAPADPQVQLLIQRLAGLPNATSLVGWIKVALASIVFELALIAIVLNMVGRLRGSGMAATVYSDGSGGSALQFALGSGFAALILPPIAWILVRAMR